MSRTTVNLLLLIALVVTIGLNSAGPADTQRRNVEYFPDMARSPRYNTFAPNPNFPDGKTLQPPVPGTIPIDDDVPRLAADATNPFSPTDTAALARGRIVFSTFCEPCHGANGAGDGLVVLHGYAPAAAFTSGGVAAMTDAAVFRLISRGASDMPSYGSQIAPSDRWKVILHVRALQARGGAK